MDLKSDHSQILHTVFCTLQDKTAILSVGKHLPLGSKQGSLETSNSVLNPDFHTSLPQQACNPSSASSRVQDFCQPSFQGMLLFSSLVGTVSDWFYSTFLLTPVLCCHFSVQLARQEKHNSTSEQQLKSTSKDTCCGSEKKILDCLPGELQTSLMQRGWRNLHLSNEDQTKWLWRQRGFCPSHSHSDGVEWAWEGGHRSYPVSCDKLIIFVWPQ